MKKGTIFWIIVATVLLIGGLIMFTTVMSANNWDFGKLSTSEYVENTYTISEDFSDISINTETADITFKLADDGKCKVECYEDEYAKHTVKVEDNTLNIKVKNEKPWYLYIGVNFNSPKLTVYLPKAEYGTLFINETTGDVTVPKDFSFKNIDITASTGDMKINATVADNGKIHTSTGVISVEDTTAGSLDLSASTGEIIITDVVCSGDIITDVSTGRNDLTNVECKNLKSNGSTGEVVLKNVIASGKFTIERSTGSVVFDGSDAKEIFVDTSTGSVTGTLLTDKVFITDTSVGSVNVPKTTSGGKCEIYTSTGSINIEIE